MRQAAYLPTMPHLSLAVKQVFWSYAPLGILVWLVSFLLAIREVTPQRAGVDLWGWGGVGVVLGEGKPALLHCNKTQPALVDCAQRIARAPAVG